MSDEHVTAVAGEIACHSEAEPSAALDITEPVGGVVTVLAPAVEKRLESAVGVTIVHARLKTVTEKGEFNSLLLFHSWSFL